MISWPQKFILALQYLYCEEVSPITKPKYFSTAMHVRYFISNFQQRKNYFCFCSTPFQFVQTLSREWWGFIPLFPAPSTAHLVIQHCSFPTTHAARWVTYSCSTAPCFTPTPEFETPKRRQNAASS